jgi:hypothetical protein
LDAGQ